MKPNVNKIISTWMIERGVSPAEIEQMIYSAGCLGNLEQRLKDGGSDIHQFLRMFREEWKKHDIRHIAE